MQRNLARLAILLPFALATTARSQQPVSRAEAVATAVSRGARAAVARADTLVGTAQLTTARAWENPSLAANYSKSTPHYHAVVDLPLDITGARGARVRSAEASRLASQYRFQFERAAAALDADTTYTRALAALERVRLSRRTAHDADSLRKMAAIRRNAGDASELDVLLATVNAGQAANLAASDSLTLISSLFDLQAVMGLDTSRIAVTPSDTLGVPPVGPLDGAAVPLPIAAAQQALTSADLSVRAQRRSIFTPFSVQAGVEFGDPGEPGILPTLGFSIPLPLLNRNRGPIAQAQAERERARAELSLAQYETRAAVGRARRQLTVAMEKIQRDRALIESANRIASMSLTAYREGAQGLPAVLEAQRNARDILSQYVSDLADAWISSATLRLYTMTVAP
ncbi:MAG TPA: TolC family protein [Gemmatimonadaceae bacterium]|nr:TolC family protein [Gemmatimonadaceae bacterium]